MYNCHGFKELVLVVGIITSSLVLLGCDKPAESVDAQQESAGGLADDGRSIETVGGRLTIEDRSKEPGDMGPYVFSLNGAEFYRADGLWGVSFNSAVRVSGVDVVPVDFLTGGNTPCIDSVGLLGVKPGGNAYWISEGESYCDATVSVEGDKVVITDVERDGHRTKTKKIYFSLNGEVSHAR